MTDAYITLTPYGIVRATFPHEAGGVVLDGPELAQAHVLSVISQATGPYGMSLAPESLNGDYYFDFCQPEGSHMKITQPVDAEIARRNEGTQDDGGEAAVLDGVPHEWHSETMEAMKRKSDDALRYIIKDATEAAEAGEKIGNPKAGQYRDEAHYASMELQRRRKGGKRVVDSADGDSDDDDDEDFDTEAEFDACPPAGDGEDVDAKLDGDFPGHPFRGNQYRKASAESHAAVRASQRAKHHEVKGSSGAKAAHKTAHYAHMAAANEATGKARNYHRKMAAFHGKRAGVRLDAVDASGANAAAVLDAVGDPEHIGGLRAQLATAAGASAKLALAKAIVADRAAFRASQSSKGSQVDAETANEVAKIILAQLGGGRFRTMTGAKDFFSLRDGLGGLSFRLPTGFSQKDGKGTGINYVKILLNSSDTYDVEFGNARPAAKSYSVVATAEGIYADSLREVFTRYTGLDTSLGTGGPGGRREPTREEVLAQQERDRAAQEAINAEWASKILAMLLPMGWSDSQYGADVKVRQFQRIGAIGTVVTPNGERNVYASRMGGVIVAKLGDDIIAKAAIFTDEDLAKSSANMLNRDVEAWAAKMAAKNGPAPGGEKIPEPKPDPVADQRAADMAELAQVEAGTHPMMLEPDMVSVIEAIVGRHPDDADVMAAVERAVNAYSNGLISATDKL